MLKLMFSPMEEAVDNGGEGGGGTGGEGGAEDRTVRAPADGAATNGGDAAGEGAGGTEAANALAASLTGGDPAKGAGREGAPGTEGASDALTPEETKAYGDALKLDESIYGKGVSFDSRYVERLPALFKKHGIPPEKANELANDFTRIQADVDKEMLKSRKEYETWEAERMREGNEYFNTQLDARDRANVVRAFEKFIQKDTPAYDTFLRTLVGVDKGVLEMLRYCGQHLATNAAPGAASGAAAEPKGIADSFMGR